jgi:uncharacterized membrane protein YjjB (DUF3815 family)
MRIHKEGYTILIGLLVMLAVANIIMLTLHAVHAGICPFIPGGFGYRLSIYFMVFQDAFKAL